ncbi:MAG: L(+)-tartrate dehydratase subunit beta [Clostridia bacterium]|nr:L(+)-tartrate dehydratase subunit beta [Clostridia bacterium]
MKKVLTTPVKDEDIIDLKAGDTVYLTGLLVTSRDDGHRRLVADGIMPEIDLKGAGLYHAGPIVKKLGDGTYQMISCGPTTSMRMEKFEKDFIRKTGVKVIIGKGGMGQDTVDACKEHKAIHCVFPGGCAVVAADEIKEIKGVEWEDFGMPEALWILEAVEFGPLMVTIDTHGNNLFAENKKIFNDKLETEFDKMKSALKFGH